MPSARTFPIPAGAGHPPECPPAHGSTAEPDQVCRSGVVGIRVRIREAVQAASIAYSHVQLPSNAQITCDADHINLPPITGP
jgi:hypothetical protein